MQEANVIPPITTQVDAHRDNAPLPHHGLRGGSKARFKAGSQVDTWAELVGWDGEFRELDADACKDRPEVKKLKEVVEKSYMVPAWLADLKSSKYTYFTGMERSHEIVEDLSFLVSRPKYTKVENDESLSGDVEECLPFLLQIIRHTNELQSHNVLFEPMKTDRRHPVDLIASLVWDIQSNGCVVYRTERLLQIPHPSERQNPGVRPDGCAYIPIPANITYVVKPELRPGLSCFYRYESSPPNCSYILHWVTEFTRRGNATNSKQQVVEGLVSALYQRRAFGFPNHFVFGTAHYNQTTLEVLAATWVPSEPANPVARSTQEAGVESSAPAEANVPSGSASRGVATAGGESGTASGTENPSLTVEEIKKYNKIVVYTIAKFSMTHISSLLWLYLLMRHTRTLAHEYQADIKKQDRALLRQLMRQAEDIYQWAPPPLPAPSDGISNCGETESETDSYMSPVAEHEDREDGDEDDMSIDQDDSSVSMSDSQELDSLDDTGPTCRIAGDVAKYTVRNYAHEYNEGTGAPKVGNPHVPELSTSQTA